MWFMWGRVSHGRLFAMMVAMNVVAAFGVLQGVVYRRKRPEPEDANAWAWNYFVGSAFYGLVFGSLGVVWFVPHDLQAQVMVLLFLAGFSAGALVTHVSLPGSLAVFHIATMAPVMVRMALYGTTFTVSLAAMICVYIGSLLWIGQEGARTYTTALRLRMRSEKMAADLSAAKHRLDVTLFSIGDGLITTNLDGAVTLFNPAAAALTGVERAHALGAPLADVYALVDEHTGDPLAACDVDHFRAVGTESVVRTGVLQAMNDKRPVVAEHSTLLRDLDDAPVGVVVAFRDLSAERSIERERSRLAADRLDSLGVLAGGIAHDFNNVLMGVGGGLRMLRDDLSAPDAGELIDEIIEAVDGAKDLTQQLLTFARGGSPVKATASLSELVQRMVKFTMRGSKSRCELVLADDLHPVDIDQAQMGQVIGNLLMNADQAMAEGGVIHVAAENISVTDHGEVDLPPGGYVRISVVDQGVGIATDALARVFEPYYTTKKLGTGLGLAAAYSIVKHHGGVLTVSSVQGQGATFRIYLPVSSQPLALDAAMPVGELPRCKPARILLMDDEPVLRVVVGRMLTHMGHDVVSVADGSAAVDAYAAAFGSKYPFALCVFDLTVPGGMGGAEAMAKIHELDPHAKGLVSSGYSESEVFARFADHGFSGVLKKPYKIGQLAVMLAKLLPVE